MGVGPDQPSSLFVQGCAKGNSFYFYFCTSLNHFACKSVSNISSKLYFCPHESDKSITLNFTWQPHILTGELVFEKTDVCSSHHFPVSHKEYSKFWKLGQKKLELIPFFCFVLRVVTWPVDKLLHFTQTVHPPRWQSTKFCHNSATRWCCFKHLFQQYDNFTTYTLPSICDQDLKSKFCYWDFFFF